MKHVLVVHYHFLPVHNVAVKQLLGYARHFPGLGWKAVVLTRDWHGVDEADASWGLSWEPHLEETSACTIHRVPTRAFRRPSGEPDDPGAEPSERAPLGRLTRKARSKLRRMRRLTVGPYPDEFVGWVRPAVTFGERLARTIPIDVIMSYCPPESNHLIARQLSRRLGIPWIPFFGDLYGFLEPPLPAYSIESLARRAWHRWCMRPAAACVGISPAMTSYLEKTYRKRAELLHAGFDPSEFPGDTPEAPARSDRFVVSHVGSLYPGDQMPELFFDGLDLLLTRAPDLKSMIEVRFVGSKCEDQLHVMLRDRPSREVCTILPRVDSATAVELVRSSAALLAFTCTATRGRFGTMSYPTKVFEALGARRPVLVVPTDDDWVAHLVSETGGGRTIRDANEIADILIGWYREWARAGTVPYGGRNEVRAGFTQQRQAARLVELFEEVSSR